MNCFDFISTPPNLFVFQKSSNKTNLGGFLFIFYLLICITISVFYFYDYLTNDKYTVSYKYMNDAVDEEDEEIYLNNTNYNPEIEFAFDMSNYFYENISGRFLLFDYNEEKFIGRNQFYKRKISDLFLGIYYICYTDCKIDLKDLTLFNYYLLIWYKGVVLDHQNEKAPIRDIEDKEGKRNFLYKEYPFFFENVLKRNIYWERFEYFEEMGFFDKLLGKNNIYYGGDIKTRDISPLETTFYNPDYGENLKLLYIVKIEMPFGEYAIYSRRKKSVLDIIANICSLSLTILSLIKIIFSNIYSNNFDPYKIVENILSNKISLSSFESSKKIDDVGISDISDLLIEKEYKDIFEEKGINKEKEKTIKLKGEDNIKNDRILPKLSMLDYLLNNFYCLKPCKSNKGTIIYSCKEILLKYLSIESILNNQIIFENLLKDYKWNNSELNNIKSSKCILKLKSLLEFNSNELIEMKLVN